MSRALLALAHARPPRKIKYRDALGLTFIVCNTGSSIIIISSTSCDSLSRHFAPWARCASCAVFRRPRRYTLIRANLYPLSRYIITFILVIISFDNRRRVVDVDKFFTMIIKCCQWNLTPKLLFVCVSLFYKFLIYCYILRMVSSDHREKLMLEQKSSTNIRLILFRDTQPHLRRNERVKRRRAPALFPPFPSIDYSIVREDR